MMPQAVVHVFLMIDYYDYDDDDDDDLILYSK